ncbi:phage tail tape measure protein [Endozoicomonas lisbonensis]|uniref:TP901 family phage tail tape measure protein n=1 Tax=Endozoicomonas lisbonensis TaxID=3120522 RepID=A0ABV2SIR6_9GAMM
MARALEKLMFTIGLIDKISSPVAKIQNSLAGLADKAKVGFASIAIGVAGLVGTGYALQSSMQPAIEMQQSLGEVRSLGVHEQALDKLETKALQFSSRYGESATDFVSASYDIQSAIAGLNGTELASFTEASGVLAKATKSDTATITSYMGTMYGIFKNQAAAMGNDNWVQVVAGQTASAVQMFKTTGSEMSAAFTSLGADATSVGVAMNEQMAVLGQLQATMSGSEAGTKYRAFLAGIDKAQNSLGLSFTDASGNILPMIDILDQLRGKYGETLSVAESAELSKAFGTKEASAMIKLLMADTAGLEYNINKLGEVKGMDTAAMMAEAMIDPWERMGAGVRAVKIGIGSALLPVLNPMITSLADGAAVLTEWTSEFPNLTRFLGTGALSILGIGAALASLNIVMGIATIVSAGYAIAMKGLGSAVLFLTSPITLVVLGIGLLIGAVVALIAYWDDIKASLMDTGWGQTVVFMLESIVGMFQQLWSLVVVVAQVMATALSPLLWILEKVAWIVGEVIGAALLALKVVAIGVFSLISMAIGGVAKVLEGVIWGITQLFKGISWVQDKVIGLLNKIPGIDIGGTQETVQTVEQIVPEETQQLLGRASQIPVEQSMEVIAGIQQAPVEQNQAVAPVIQPTPVEVTAPAINLETSSEPVEAPKVESLQASRASTVPSGGVSKSITNAINNNSSRSVHVGKIETSQPAQSIEYDLMLIG